jgi:hypothetical protein
MKKLTKQLSGESTERPRRMPKRELDLLDWNPVIIPPSNLDWDKIESATRVAFSPALRLMIHSAVTGSWRLFRRDHQPLAEDDKRERKILRKIENSCRTASDALRDYQSFVEETGHTHALFGRPRTGGSEWEAMKALILPEMAESIKSVACFAARANERWPIRKTGRPPDDDLRQLISLLHYPFRLAGGKGGAYPGRFSKMVMEILNQIGYPFQSHDAVAELIHRQLAPRKKTNRVKTKKQS